MNNEVIEQFGKILRYYICGAVFIVTIFYSYNWNPYVNGIKNSGYLFIPFIPGSLIYVIHRSFINVLIEWFRKCIQKKIKCCSPNCNKYCLLPKCELGGMFIRWGVEKNTENAWKQIRTWGDHVQLLYSSGLSVLLAGSLTQFFDKSEIEYVCSYEITLTCIIFYIVAFFSDIRKQIAEVKLYEIEQCM